MMKTFALQAYDLVKMTAILIFWAYVLGTEKLLDKQEQNVTNSSIQPQAKDSTGENCSLRKTNEIPCVAMPLRAQWPHNSNLHPL